MPWIYLSPHFDDVALSCGGLVWEQVNQGEQVGIWTVCAGKPPFGGLSPFAEQLHARWKISQNATAQRKIEDFMSCHRLGATPRYFSIPDCIYRRAPHTHEPLYASEAALNGHLQPGDSQFITPLRDEISRSLRSDATLVCPLGLGDHVDHQLTRQMAEGLNRPLWYYADYPYVLRSTMQVERMDRQGWICQVFPISGEGLLAWMEAISNHSSQISTFWSSDVDMRKAIMDYLHMFGGIRLWKNPVA